VLIISGIRLDNLNKVYLGGIVAIKQLRLEVRSAEYLVIVGPSGCGKTTTLRLIAGLEEPTSGQVFLADQDATSWPPHQRDIAVVFQDSALFPHFSVSENIAFGLKLRRHPTELIAERVRQTAERLQLRDLLERRPQELSGGERRRVAIARALARRPRFLLLDEPLSNLDPPARLQLRGELARLHHERPTTTIHVTHDQEEALSLGERVAVLNDGQLQQIDTPPSLYRSPANAFVAGFIGSPTMNFFPWTLKGKPCRLGVRPRDIRLGGVEGADVVAVVESLSTVGHECHVQLCWDNGPVTVVVTEAPVVGERVGLRFNRNAMHFFDAVTGVGIEVGGCGDNRIDGD
jgi:ABC-type sugar transport system ATPase subunit